MVLGTRDRKCGAWPLDTSVVSCISHASVPATWAFRNSLGTDVAGASQTENFNLSDSTGGEKVMGIWNNVLEKSNE